MAEGFGNGISINVWVRRTGSGGRQRILDLGTAAGVHLVLGTGDQADSLAIGIEQGSTRTELVCEGALPLNRWVKVTALATMLGIAKLSVFDIDLEQGIIGTVAAGAFTECSIAGGAAGSPFVGSLSGLEIYQLPRPSWGGGGSPSVLWGKYPLTGITYLKTVDTVSGPVKYYKVDDVSAKNNDGVVEGGLAAPQFATTLGGSAVPVLQMDGMGKTLFLSPIQGLGGSLTLETWFNPTSTQEQQSMIILSDDKDVSLVVTVGGNSPNGGGNLEVVLCKGSEKTSLLYTAYGENAGVFQHLAVTFARSEMLSGKIPIVMSLYLNGQLITSQTVMSDPLGMPSWSWGTSTARKFLPLLALLNSVVVPNVRLGGTIADYKKYKGQLAEFRIWKSCRTAKEIATRFLSRLVGNEPNLAACYRLEQSVSGCVFDVSDQRGLGSLQPGSTIGTASNLPLLHTSDPSAPHLRVKGKLLSEHMVYTTAVDVTIGVPDININLGGFGGGTITGGSVNLSQRSERVTVFDATIEPVSPDGSTQVGKTIQICPDGDVTVYFAGDNNVYKPTVWSAKQTYSVTVPSTGKVRLRFKASSLSLPTLRVRYQDMTEGLWSLVRPDSQALAKLALADGPSLKNPPQGKASPLPASVTDEDASLCATTLAQIGRGYRPVQYADSPIYGEARSILGTLENAWNDATDWAGDTASTVGSTLQKAGQSAGKFSEALVDDGKTALSQVASVTKNAGSLLSTAAGDLNQLINATANAVPRFGQDQIKQCIATADRLAVVSTAAVNAISHTFSVIGTTIIDGVTYAWRVVVNGVLDAISTIVAFLKKVGATIQKILDYLAWLFNWNDFLAASDKIYSAIETEFGKAKDQIAKVSSYKAELSKYLTLPAGVGDKSLAQHCGVNIPDDLGAEEIDYVMDLANTVMSATNLNLDFMNQFSQQVGNSQSLLDTTQLRSLGSSVSQETSDSPISNPVALLTTPIQQLVNSMTTGDSQTTIVDFLFDQLTSITDTILGSARTMLTARLSVPNVTGWVENTILGGRTLSLLRIASLVAAIAQVLAVKISASAKSGKAEPQPVSFADDSQPADYSAQLWSNFALSVLTSFLEIPRALGELAIAKSADPEQLEKAACVKMAAWDTMIGAVGIARSGLNYYANARLPKDIQFHLGLLSGLDAVSAGFLILTSWCKAFSWSINEPLLVFITKCLELAGQTAMTIISVGLAATAATFKSLFPTALDWTVFGFQIGSYLFNQAGQLTTAYIELTIGSKNIKQLSPYVPVGFSVATALLDLGSGITNAAQNA